MLTRFALVGLVLLLNLETIFGQEKLASGKICTDADEYGVTHINSDWICFSRSDIRKTLLFSKRTNGKWGTPVEAPFSKKWDNEYPSFNRMTWKLYFSSTRPKPGQENTQGRNDIWFVTYENGEWSEPTHLGGDFSSEGIDSGGFEEGGSIYFHSDRDGRGLNSVDIYTLSSPNLTARKIEVSTDKVDGEVFVFDQGRKMLFMSAGHGAIGKSDIFISEFKNGEWQNPIPVDTAGLVNTSYWDYAPSLSPDRSLLYFTHYVDGQADIFWIEVDELANKQVVQMIKGS